jgi:hypothetical protein
VIIKTQIHGHDFHPKLRTEKSNKKKYSGTHVIDSLHIGMTESKKEFVQNRLIQMNNHLSPVSSPSQIFFIKLISSFKKNIMKIYSLVVTIPGSMTDSMGDN